LAFAFLIVSFFNQTPVPLNLSVDSISEEPSGHDRTRSEVHDNPNGGNTILNQIKVATLILQSLLIQNQAEKTLNILY